MKKIFFSLIIIMCFSSSAQAFWVWTPETGKFINPKYAVKETPQKQLDYGLEVYQSGELNEAEREMRKLIKHYPKARQAADAQFYIAKILNEGGDPGKAFKAYQLLLEKYPFTQRTANIIENQFMICVDILEGSDEKKTLWQKVSSGNIDLVEMFETVIKNAPYGKYAAISQYKIGLYLKEEGLLDEARDAFEKTFNDYPSSEWAQAARYQIAKSDAERSAKAAYDQKITQTAISEFEDFLEDHPNADLSDEAREHVQDLRLKEAENQFIVAEFYLKQKKYDSARLYFSDIIDNFPGTIWAQRALKKLQEMGEE